MIRHNSKYVACFMINGSTADLLWVIADTGKSNGNISLTYEVHSSSKRAERKCSMFFSLDASETDPPLLLFKERECVHCDDIRRVVLSLITVPLRVHPTPPWKMTYEEPCLRASILTFFCCINTLPKHYISKRKENQWKSWPQCAWLRTDKTFWFTTPYQVF